MLEPRPHLRVDERGRGSTSGPMNILAMNWWALATRGLLALAFGFMTWAWPRLTLTILVVLFGIYMVVDGIFALVSAARTARRHARWWPVALEGVLGLVAGVVAFLVPAAAAWALLIVVAAWALSTGILEIVAAIRLRKEIKGEWLLALSGVLSLAFGVLLLLQPAAGLLALVWLIGAYAVLYGAVLLALSMRLKRSLREAPAPAPTIRGGITPQPV
jgi:uncharacterized membrane protein HdeD (DUF308 family)